MHPPAATCRAIADKHPFLRLAWMGRPRRGDALNQGDFAVVQLMHYRDCGSYDDPLTFREFWEVETVMDELGMTEVRRVDRGPVFNAKGGTARDWNPLIRRPVLLFTVNEDYQLSIRDVYTGDMQHVITAWSSRGGRPLAKKLVKVAKDRGKEMVSKKNTLVDQMTASLMEEARKSDTSPIIARKHIKREDLTDNYVNYKEGKLDLTDYYLNKVPQGLRKISGD